MTWVREMLALFRAYRQAGRDYKAALQALDAEMERMRHGDPTR